MPVAPGRAWASSDEMKMCSISVAPMPSMISMPVASRHSWRVAATHLRSEPPSGTESLRSRTAAAIARYEVGAANSTVAPNVPIASSRSGGEAFSSRTTCAPTLIGNSVSPPSPKVNASGGLPMNTSSAVAFNTCGGKHTQLAITSRWKCIVAFGWPVVPEVNASRQVSSTAVATLSNRSG